MSKEVITEFEVGMRLDKVLALAFPQYSRSALEKLIISGDVLVNGKQVVTKYKTKPKDLIEVDLALFQHPTPRIELPILYEDDSVVVINKPAGVLTHAKGTHHNEATVATWLKSRVIPTEVEGSIEKSTDLSTSAQDDEKGGFWQTNRAGIVHRLDRGTSGVMICAKNEAAQTHLQKQFANRKVKKSYYAVISNPLPEQEGIIDLPIERNPKKPASFRVGVNGKPAQTHFKIAASTTDSPQTSGHFVVELKPETGRTHQLRVHLAYLKAPIVGDELYNGEPYSRLMLHAHSLEITLPNSQRKVFTAPLPPEFESFNA